MTVKVTTYHLEMTRRDQLKPARLASGSLDLTRAMIPSPELNRYLYTAVGAGWYWVDRLSWTYDTWMAYLDRPELETWVARVSGTPAGYFELEAQPGGSVEIAYFGLLPRFVGQGLGGPLLTAAIERGWEMGAARVWVHTCTLDHPAALANYRARGMQLFDEVVSQQDLPDAPPGPWPGAGR
ncbi:MAG TPA: GNAT family N-acetyltransferase [Candidatus Polarisedimenticolia bacterium]|nr:GNAT family N-acetyltransferase [Candidatus Polarisedimenticolia bacterium]